MTAVFTDVESMQAAVSSIMVPLQLTAPLGTPFQVQVSSAHAGEVAVARIEDGQGLVDRRHRLITSTDPELFMVALDRRGPVCGEQDGRRHRARRGELMFLDTTRPYRLRYDDPCDAVILMVPRASLGLHADGLRGRTAVPLSADSGTRAVVSAFFSGLGAQMDHMPGPSGAPLGHALTALLVAAISQTAPERSDPATELSDKIAAYVLVNIADPGLCVESVARRFAISPRKLHRLFARRPETFAAWLREERLRRVHHDLRNPAFAQRTVAAIAARWGLYDPAHLSRLFTARFGQTPAEVRRLGPHRNP
ncbi:helix-turn-helix domain-containing protein [Streptomyces sp. NPDC020917]|uniref:AraC-like ligand-binding domain-containing protein n=1 Tax=Streptomyces sp. NPDC020917 TaxID=3365102 RepID=UPI0037B4F572